MCSDYDCPDYGCSSYECPNHKCPDYMFLTLGLLLFTGTNKFYLILKTVDSAGTNLAIVITCSI